MKKIIALAMAAALIAALPLTAKTPKKTTVPTQSTQTTTKPSNSGKTSSGKTTKNAGSSYDDPYFHIGEATFQILSPTTCSFVNLDMSYSGAYQIPEQVKYKGKTYTVTSIFSAAIHRNSKLTALSIPPSITEIPERCFIDETGLASVILPNTIKSIGEQAFWRSGIKSITIPESVTSIGEGAFDDCSSLKSVTLNCDILQSWKRSPFSNCPSLEAFYGKYASPDHRCLIKDGKLLAFASAGLSSYTFPSTITEISGNALCGCEKLTTVVLPNSLTKIRNAAFASCKELESITIPASVTSIGDNAFYNCLNLKDVKILNPGASISKTAFERTSWGRHNGYKW